MRRGLLAVRYEGYARAVRRLLLLSALVLASGIAAGCGDDDGDEAGPDVTGATPQRCSAENLETKTPGKLTIATDNPAFPPWFEGRKANEPWDPTTTPTKKGYEAQVAYAIAEELDFSDDQVEWTVVPFNQLFRPGPKDFDFDINQVSYSEERAQVLDFSESYYDVEQAVVTTRRSEIADAESLADLKDAKLGAAIGTTSYDTILEVIDPNPKPSVYDTNNDAISALKAEQVDGIVVDYPTSLYVSAVQVEGGTIVGRLPRLEDAPERFGVVFEKDSPLVECVNAAIAELRQNGTLKRLEERWIIGSAPPVLR
jgi:polar amino acid transport system substrate-binding protein